MSSFRVMLQITGVAIAAAILLPACASRSSNPVTRTNSGKIFAVTANSTSFYRFGPQQGNGADQQLPKDTLVTLIRPSFGYCKVQLLQNSVEGYVASEDIRPAPPTLLAALNAVADPGISPGGENIDVNLSEPPPPEALPDPDLPPSSETATVPLP